MSEKQIEVRDEGDLRKYRIELPNIIDDMGLTVFEFRLYVHLKRVAGASGGECKQSARAMAKHCNMSLGKTTGAKRGLIDKGLIEIAEHPQGKHETNVITIVDIWEKNYKKYSEMKRSRDERSVRNTNRSVQVANSSVQVMNRSVHVVDPKKEPIKKEPIKKEEIHVELKPDLPPSTEFKIPEKQISKMVFDHWKEVMKHPRAIFSPERKAKIEARIREGATFQECLDAIDGCALSPFHMGKLPGCDTVYDSIELIFRSRSQLEKFIDIKDQATQAEAKAKAKANGSAKPAEGSELDKIHKQYEKQGIKMYES